MSLTGWFKKLFSPAASASTEQLTAQRVSGKDYGITPNLVSVNALKTLKRLRDMRKEAYIVGGSVRDMLAGKKPKDFDIATAARPEEMRKFFRNCRLIGRRFRLAHIYFNDEIIEVATFRASDSHQKKTEHTNEHGMILHDNVYGTLDEDALRRDFTVNALYYDPINDTIIDFADGLTDIKHKTIRLIGDPQTRYREDPVRMLRAIRFAAKLNFTLEKHTAQPIDTLKHLIKNVSNARLFEEMLKLFFTGHAYQTYQQLEKYDLLTLLFPAIKTLTGEDAKKFVTLFSTACHNTDERLANGKNINPAFLLSTILWLPLEHQLRHPVDPEIPFAVQFDQTVQALLQEQLAILAIPRRFTQMMREIWEMQSRLLRRHPRMIQRLLEHPRFRAAYDFLLLRVLLEPEVKEAADWWTTLQQAEGADRHNMIAQLKTPPKRRRSRK